MDQRGVVIEEEPDASCPGEEAMQKPIMGVHRVFVSDLHPAPRQLAVVVEALRAISVEDRERRIALAVRHRAGLGDAAAAGARQIARQPEARVPAPRRPWQVRIEIAGRLRPLLYEVGNHGRVVGQVHRKDIAAAVLRAANSG